MLAALVGRDGVSERGMFGARSLTRDGKGAATFEPQEIDADSGVGTQVTAGDVNKDGKPDVVVANKRGVFVFRQQ